MKTPIIELTIDDEDVEENGIFAISIVDFPAIEKNFIALSKDKKQVSMAAVDDDQHLLIGAALIPNKMILRLDEDDAPYYIHFSKDTIKRAAYRFLKNNMTHNHTLQHDEQIKGLYVVESWIVSDPANDKSASLGLDVTKGTWMVAIKVDNEEIWKKQIKTGEVKGFSIEAYFDEKLRAINKDVLISKAVQAAKEII